jgi:hypothetical protein
MRLYYPDREEGIIERMIAEIAQKHRMAAAEGHENERIPLNELARFLRTYPENLPPYVEAVGAQVGADGTVSWLEALEIQEWYIGSGALGSARRARGSGPNKAGGALIIQGGRPESKRR